MARLLCALGPIVAVALGGYLFFTAAPGLIIDGKNPYEHTEVEKLKIGHIGHPPTTALAFLPFASLELNDLSPTIGLLMVVFLAFHCVLLSTQLAFRAPLACAYLPSHRPR